MAGTKLIKLDLNEADELYGWEMHKNPIVISAMRESIKLGQYFPAVDIVKSEDGIYQILTRNVFNATKNYGGHNRSFSHYKEKTPLLCRLWEENTDDVEDIKFRPIKEIKLDGELNNYQLRNTLLHLPPYIAKEFCRKNKLFPEYYLY